MALIYVLAECLAYAKYGRARPPRIQGFTGRFDIHTHSSLNFIRARAGRRRNVKTAQRQLAWTRVARGDDGPRRLPGPTFGHLRPCADYRPDRRDAGAVRGPPRADGPRVRRLRDGREPPVLRGVPGAVPGVGRRRMPPGLRDSLSYTRGKRGGKGWVAAPSGAGPARRSPAPSWVRAPVGTCRPTAGLPRFGNHGGP